MMTPMDRLLALPIWQGNVAAAPLGGGITNVNFLAEDSRGKVVVRIGEDIPVHQILRFNEQAASRAAHAAGISPPVLYAAPGALVLGYIDGRTYDADAVRGNLDAVLDLIIRTHRDVPRHLRGPVLSFWVFHVIRDYGARLVAEESPCAPLIPALLREAEALEKGVGRVEIVFGHNDLLPANFIEDSARLWLVDWDYAGFNSPLFDLGGLAANNGLTGAEEARLLNGYFDREPDADLWHRYLAMKAASALRETLWSMVSETHSDLHFDYAAYSAANLATYRAAYDTWLHT
jgi:thiamine kinase-like enzyme